MNKKPLVSIIMPVYNTEAYLEEAIDSVIAQTYDNWELICVDDGSTDNSLKIIRSYTTKDKRIRMYKNKINLGVSKTSNYAITKALGTFIARFDSDDIMPCDRVQNQVDFLVSHPDVVVVGGQVEILSPDGIKVGDKLFPTKHQEIYEGMYNIMTIQQGAMMINTNKIPNGFVWYKDDFRTAEEVDLFFRLFKYGKFANLPVVTLYYRQHRDSASLSDPKKTFINTYEVRKVAKKKYGYVTTFKSEVINLMQYLLVTLLPCQAIYPLFTILRGIVSVKTRFGLLFVRSKSVLGKAN